jgi:hypothetical protein
MREGLSLLLLLASSTSQAVFQDDMPMDLHAVNFLVFRCRFSQHVIGPELNFLSSRYLQARSNDNWKTNFACSSGTALVVLE